MVLAADGGVAQQQVAASVDSNGSSLTLANIKAPKNGYAYVYVSNQSNNDVYFDNLQAGIVQGNIAEENHYYAYGLKIATLSSKKLGDSYEGSLKNNYLYQGDYSELDDDIGWHDFALRNYDAQIGRWVQQDPYQEFASPYVGMGSDPINLTDPSGGSTLPYQVIKLGGEMSQTAATAITLGEVVLKSVSTVSKSVSTLGGLLKAANITFRVFQVANVLNNAFNTVKVGDPVADYLNGIMTKEIDKGIEDLWNKSGHGTENAREWGGTITEKDGKYSLNFVHEGQPGWVTPQYPSRLNKKHGRFIAAVHTHPYATKISLGNPFSTGDVLGLKDILDNQGIIKGPLDKPISIVDAGSNRYALVIEDIEKAKSFFQKNDEAAINVKYNEGYRGLKNGTGVEKSKAGLLNVLGDSNESGISLYETGSDKTKFIKVKAN